MTSVALFTVGRATTTFVRITYEAYICTQTRLAAPTPATEAQHQQQQHCYIQTPASSRTYTHIFIYT